MKLLDKPDINRYMYQPQAGKILVYLLFGFILTYTLIPRLFMCRYGLPYIYFSDDKFLVDVALNILEDRDLNPYWMGFPGSIIMYILAVIFGAITFVNFLYNLWVTKDVSSFSEYINIQGKNWDFNPVVYNFSGRCFMVLIAASTILVVFYFTRKRFGMWAAVLGALCLAVSPLYLRHSIMVRPDVFASFMILLTLVFLVKYFENIQKIRYLILAGLFCGFSVSAKYPSALVFLPLAAGGIGLDIKNVKFKSWAYIKSALCFKTALSRICLFAFLGFLISTPYFFIDIDKVIKNLLFEANPNRFGVSRLPGIENHLWYLNAVKNGLGGAPVLLVCLTGFIKIFHEKKFHYYLFFAFPVLYFVFIGCLHLRWDRWIIPILPFASILFGLGVVVIVEYFIKIIGNKKIAITLASFALVFILSPVVKQNIILMTKFINTDTRTISKQWIEQNIKENSTIVCETHCPQLWIKPKREFKIINRGWDLVISEPLDNYIDSGADYIILSSSWNDTYLSEPEKFIHEKERLQEISENCQLIKEFSPTDINRGPLIKIYKTRTSK